MKKLSDVLSEYAGSPEFGGKSPEFGDEMDLKKLAYDEAAKERRAESLKKDVHAISEQNRTYFFICFSALVALFVGACLLVVFSLDNPDRVKAVLAASGISILGVTTQMMKFWKEKVRAELMLALVNGINPGELKPILEIILKSFG